MEKTDQGVSIVIVSYNVRQFIVKCLESIYANIPAGIVEEIYVVDNASVDGTTDEVARRFPQVTIISNDKNVGFGAANNLALRQITSKYTLILNPDTLLEDDTLSKCIEFIDGREKVGMVGVKMIDGNGMFLPESKRSLPSIISSFYKFTGLIKWYPKSKKIGAYYMGHLNEDTTSKVEVITGAFMFAKTAILKEVDFFDERFFMYGEDIDLSRKVIEKGYDIFYLPTTKIIHFKGESTKKGDINYSIRFYSAISKYYSKYNEGFSKHLISMAVLILGVIGYSKELVRQYVRPICHIGLSYLGFDLMRSLWAKYYHNSIGYYDNSIFFKNAVMYVLVLAVCNWLFGVYDKKPNIKNYLLGFSSAFVIILLIYSLLPEPMRSSRALIVFGIVCSFIMIKIFDWLWHRIVNKEHQSKNTVIVGSKESAETLKSRLLQKYKDIEIIGVISINENKDPYYLNDVGSLDSVVSKLSIENIVFSNKDMTNKAIFDLMVLPEQKVNYLIASHSNDFIVSSSDKTKQGNIFEIKSTYNLAKPVYRRIKRTYDLVMSMMGILLFPIVKVVLSSISFKELTQVLLNKKTIISYQDSQKKRLPSLKPGVFDTSLIDAKANPKFVLEENDRDKYYAKMYNPIMDLQLLFKNMK